MAPVTFTMDEYFQARVPDIQTLLPGYSVAMANNAAMALYWSYWFPSDPSNPSLDESRLSERQKVMGALRAVMGVIPVVTKGLTRPQVVEADAGTAKSKFEERSRIYKQLIPIWADELLRLEAAEGIFFDLIPNIPAYLKLLTQSFPENIDPFASGFVYAKDTYFLIEGGDRNG